MPWPFRLALRWGQEEYTHQMASLCICSCPGCSPNGLPPLPPAHFLPTLLCFHPEQARIKLEAALNCWVSMWPPVCLMPILTKAAASGCPVKLLSGSVHPGSKAFFASPRGVKATHLQSPHCDCHHTVTTERPMGLVGYSFPLTALRSYSLEGAHQSPDFFFPGVWESLGQEQLAAGGWSPEPKGNTAGVRRET